ncbi:MAG: hypothetical protein QM780_05340 [Hyphomicrobium sp.]|uniref:hypothetical protein n=1 Tax=Hyphomicrobium sp. TaxID=82 RepID=UPI0039E2995E
MVLSVMAMGMMAIRFGGSAAADESRAANVVATPVSLAGRWVGQYYGYGRSSDEKGCGETGCRMTFDVVACKDGWCGIAIKDDKSCGAIGLHLAAADAKTGEHIFTGRLEIAKGAAPYVVQAWHDADKETGAVELHFVGDTGSELLMYRRSYPFEATLARSGDAVCTLDKATS